MKISNIHPALKTAGLTAAFLVIAAALIFTAGRSLTEYLATITETAVEMGAPIYEYDSDEKQPADGTLKKSEVAVPSEGCRYGTITCDEIKLKASLYYGDSDKVLSHGAGQYTGSCLPGEGGIILVGAHDVGYFEPLEKAEKGQKIKVHTTYGDFEYSIYELKAEDASYIDDEKLAQKDREILILYTCYPFGDVLENSTQRYFVMAEKVSGPVLTEE